MSLHSREAWQHIQRGLPPSSGRRGVLKEATLVAHLPQPGHGLAIGEEAHRYLHFVHVPVGTEPQESHSQPPDILGTMRELPANPRDVLKSDTHSVIDVAVQHNKKSLNFFTSDTMGAQ